MTVLRMTSPLTPASSSSPRCSEQQLPTPSRPSLSFSVAALLADDKPRSKPTTITCGWQQQTPEDLSPTDLSQQRPRSAVSSRAESSADDEVASLVDVEDRSSGSGNLAIAGPLRPTPGYGFGLPAAHLHHPSAAAASLWSQNAAALAAASFFGPSHMHQHYPHAPLNGESHYIFDFRVDESVLISRSWNFFRDFGEIRADCATLRGTGAIEPGSANYFECILAPCLPASLPLRFDPIDGLKKPDSETNWGKGAGEEGIKLFALR